MFKQVEQQKYIKNVWRSTETVERDVKPSWRSIFRFRQLRAMSAMPVVSVVLLFLALSLAACSETEETEDPDDTENTDQPVSTDGDTDDTETDTGQDDTEPDQTDQEPSGTVDTIGQDDSAQQPTDQDANGDTAVLLSDDVPSIEMIDLSSGDSVNLRSLVGGEQSVLLWFWAPHCPICRGEAPEIEELARENSHRLKVVGVGAFDDLDYAHRFVADTGTTFTMLWSDSADVWNHYGVRVNSHFWVLDANGNRVGTSSQAYDRALVEGLLEDIT